MGDKLVCDAPAVRVAGVPDDEYLEDRRDHILSVLGDAVATADEDTMSAFYTSTRGQPMSDTRNIFISHIHEDDEHIEGMKALLTEKGFSVRDSSIDSSNPNSAQDHDYIKREILAPAIVWASAVVVLISPGTKNSWWVDWEIEEANRTGKRIVGVWTHGAGECDVPEALDQYADAVVGWQAERIYDAISGDLNNWQTSDGKSRERVIARHGC